MPPLGNCSDPGGPDRARTAPGPHVSSQSEIAVQRLESVADVLSEWDARRISNRRFSAVDSNFKKGLAILARRADLVPEQTGIFPYGG